MNLLPYQRAGVDKLKQRNRVLLGDEMGLGKTIQAIVAAKELGLTRIVVLCPAIAVENWHREFKIWGATGICIIIRSYDMVRRHKSLCDEIRALKPELMVLDEGHYLKSHDSKRTATVYGKNCDGSGLVSCSERVWVVTGTPCPNNAAELYPMFRALFPELITNDLRKPMSYMDFVKKYTVYMATEYGIKIIGNKPGNELRTILHSIMIRRRVADVIKDMPELFWSTPVLEASGVAELSDFEQALDDEAKQLIVTMAEGTATESLEDVHLATLRRITEKAKATVVAKLIAEELADKAYEKIIIFGTHKEALHNLFVKLGDFNPVIITGATPPAARTIAIDAFQKDPATRVFIGNIQACSTAITLTAANQVAFLNLSWNPADNIQAAKRAHRIGQTKPVFVRAFGLAKSIDDAVTQVLVRKTRAISQLTERDLCK